MNYKLHKIDGGQELPSDTLPTYDPVQRCWDISVSGEAWHVNGLQSDYTVIGGPVTYPDISQNVFIGLAMAVAALTDATLVAIRNSTDPDEAAFWIRFSLAISISRPGNGVAGQNTADGLALLVAKTRINQAGSDAIVANWPRS
jgi:hypothetical protein